jgi:hypothetical protein
MGVKLMAVKPHRYGGKRVRAGQVYEAAEPHARVLKGARLAVSAPIETRKVVIPRRDLVTCGEVSQLTQLREDYERLSGEPADRRWGEARLVREVDALAHQEKERDEDAGEREASDGD